MVIRGLCFGMVCYGFRMDVVLEVWGSCLLVRGKIVIVVRKR